MKKALLIMAAALMTMTQCKKQETMPVTPAADTIKMTITAGPGRTSIDTETGAITWSADDKLYVSDGTSWLGSLTLIGEGGSSQGLFTGNVAIGGGTTPCHFFYLGHDNGMTEPKAGTSTDAVISLASQDGTLAGAMKYHIGYGTTDVTVESGEYEGYVVMNTKIAIAHINFTTDGTTAYTKPVNMGGEGFCNTMTVSPDGSFSGSGTDGIAIGNGGGTTGERFVTLIPTGETSIFVAFTGDATGSMAFANGIVENKFYGMKDAVKVTVTPKPKFSVGENTTVEFSPGNLYWDGSAFKFEANQWDFSVGEWNESTQNYYWDASHVSHFYWSKMASVAYAASYSESGTTTSDVFFTNGQSFQVAGEMAGTWRTLSGAEWDYLLKTRDNASSLRTWKDLGNNVKGLVILPDGTDASVMSSITSTADLETYGAVFLPASGYRSGTDVKYVGSNGDYWSGTPRVGNVDRAHYLHLTSGDAFTGLGNRWVGYAVRLVR